MKKGKKRFWRIDPKRAKDVAAGNFKLEGEVEILQRTVVIYLGIKRLTHLKDRVKRREKDKWNSKGFLKRMKEDWKMWADCEEMIRRRGNVVLNYEGEEEQTVNRLLSVINDPKKRVETDRLTNLKRDLTWLAYRQLRKIAPGFVRQWQEF